MFLLRRLLVPCAGLPLLLTPLPAASQSAAAGTVVTGTVRGPDGAPIPAASVSAATTGGVAARSTTDGSGRYRLLLSPRLDAFELRVERVGYYRFSTQLIVGPAGGAVVRDVRLRPSSIGLQPLEVRSTRPAQRPPQGPTPGGNEEAWQSFFTDPYPTLPGDLGAIAGLRPGVLSLGRGEDGALPRVSITGRDPSQNRVLVDGAAFGAASVPPEALRSTSVISSSYDPARGQFSGGQIAATTRSGTNLFGGALRLRLQPALLQAGRTGASGGDGYSVAELGGGAGGALLPGRLFWFAAVQASRNPGTLATLASIPAGTLAGLGISADSVSRFRTVTSGLGFATAWQRPGVDVLSQRASALVRIDVHAADAHTLTLRLDGRAAETRGLGASAYGLGGPGQRVSRASGGVLAQVASYRGPTRNELRAYHSTDVRRRRGGTGLPGGAVDVLSDLGEGRSGLARLSFGDVAVASDARSTLTEVSDELLVHLQGEEHRLKLGITLSRESTLQHGLAAASGTFAFRSLADLEHGRPLSFTRTLGGGARAATAEYAAFFVAHQWHAAPRLWVIQGVRVEATRWPGAPVPSEALRTRFGGSPGSAASPLAISPRIGAVYQAAGSQWGLRGGLGRFVGTLPLAALADAFGEAGGGATLVCVGSAAPAPEWERYAADPGAIPTRCADGGGRGASSAVAATLFARGFRPPSTWRASAGAGGPLLQGRRGRLDLHLDAGLVVGTAEPIAIDLNLAREPAFLLAAEGSRPVFAPVEGIDAATGAIDPALSRVAPAFGTVREAASRGRSTVAQLTTGITFLSSRFDLLSAYYTFTRATDAVTGFRAPGGFAAPVAAGDPNRLSGGPSDLQRRHNVQLMGIHPVGKAVEIGFTARVVSGAPFTPLVDADVNGDGVANDAAFVFGAGGDPELVRGIERLSASAALRRCLARQTNRVAARNSCTGPWRASLDLQVNVPVERGSRASRFTASVAASNVLAGLDRALHGARGLHGWGGDGAVDATLLRVRGFDAERRTFLYAVNSSFGSGRPDPFGMPATVTLSGRITLGSDPARQPLLAMTAGIRARGRTAAELGGEIAGRIPNTPGQVLELADTLRLALSDAQRVALTAQAEALGARLAPLTDSLAAALSVVERGGDDARRTAARIRSRQVVVEMQGVMDEVAERVRGVLTPAQWARLPEDVRRPARQLAPPRTLAGSTGESW